MYKSDLDNMQVVETRDGRRYLSLADKLIGLDGVLELKSYNDDLTYLATHPELSIDIVYDVVGAKDVGELNDILLNVDNLKVIWERKYSIGYYNLPPWSKVQVRSPYTSQWENAYFIEYKPGLASPFIVTKHDQFTYVNIRQSVEYHSDIRLHPDCNIIDAWIED